MKIYSIGIGPGSGDLLTPLALQALESSQVIVAYKGYLQYIEFAIKGKEVIGTGMKRERDRAWQAFEQALSGKTVAVVSSGDSGIYGMAPLLWEMKEHLDSQVEIEVIPGISAVFSAAAKLGAPLGHDFCTLSLSDLLTPWERIEKRIEAAAAADFVTAVYNPLSKGRFWQLMRLKEIFLGERSPYTPVGVARQVARKGESYQVLELRDLQPEMVDMFTLILIGNSQTRTFHDKMITPRGYYQKKQGVRHTPGRTIMHESFQTILKEVDFTGRTLGHKWIALHCIHTTADFQIIESLNIVNNAVERLHQLFYSEQPPVIVTDVSMVTRGIRRSAVKQLGLQVKCYLDDDRVVERAKEKGITRTQAGIQLAVQEHPNALYAFGNAPTALIELVEHIRNGNANPAGVVAAPVGFVNVRESKWQLQYGCPNVPAVIIGGRKGGSNVAATIINAVLSWGEAEDMAPGQGL
jgi:precorrin-3B C17-methyltransferase